MRQREMQGFQRGDAHSMDHTSLQPFMAHGGGGVTNQASVGSDGDGDEQVTIAGGAGSIPNPTPSNPHAGQMQRMGGVIAPAIDPSVVSQRLITDKGTGDIVGSGEGYQNQLQRYKNYANTVNSPGGDRFLPRDQAQSNLNQMRQNLDDQYQPVDRVSLAGGSLSNQSLGLHKDYPAGTGSQPLQGSALGTGQKNIAGAELLKQHQQQYATNSANAISPGQIVPNGQKAMAGQFHASDLNTAQMASLTNTMQSIGPNASNYTAAYQATKPRLGYDRQMAPKVGGGGQH